MHRHSKRHPNRMVRLPPLSSRRYIKRIWRVPKDRGATEYLATLITKALVKHGWPAGWKPSAYDPWAFVITYEHPDGREAGQDFWSAVEIATNILARTYRVDVAQAEGVVCINRRYQVTTGGHFREEKA